MRPPADVPSAPSRPARSSSAIPCAAIAERRSTVRRPGSPEAVVAFGSGSPSVCATSYLGIPQLRHGNAAVVAEGDTCMAGIPGACGDAFRTGLPRLFKKRWPVLEAGSLR
jgi:hypothetical protein